MANELECCFIGRGPLSLQEQVDFCPTTANPNTNPTFYLGNASVFSVQPEFEEKSIKDFRRAAGNACESKLISSINLNMTVNCFKDDVLELALAGESTSIATSAVTNETHAVNSLSDLVHFNFIADKTTVVVTNVGGGTTYVLGTDYNLITPNNNATGTATGIEIIPTGTIVIGDIEFDYTRIDQTQFSAFTFVNKTFILYFDGFNAEDGSAVYATYWKVKIGAATQIDWIGDDYIQLQFEGEVLFDDCNNEYARVLRAA